MSKFDELITLYTEQISKLKLSLDISLVQKVAKGLGPSIYNKDSSTVACSDKAELDRLKANFLIKKLGLADSPELDKAIKAVCEEMGSSNKNKYRPLFYALLVKKFKKESVYS